MNIASYSPALTLLFAWALLWILMNVQWYTLSDTQKRVLPLCLILLLLITQVIRTYFGTSISAKLIFFTMHLPTFLVFRQITNVSAIKMVFMIFTALVFTAPSIIIGNAVRFNLAPNSDIALLIANLFSYAVILLIAQIMLRKGFYYLLRYGEDNLFFIFSTIPLLYYFYVFAFANLDIATPGSINEYFVRSIPTLEVFLFYFLLPHVYKFLIEKQVVEASHTALHQELDAAKKQVSLLNESQTEMAIYRHDMRHHFMVLHELLSGGKSAEAQSYIETISTNMDTIEPKRYCKHDIVNLLCTSFALKATQMDIQLNITARLPQTISISDPELCAILSNGLENALHAVEKLEPSFRYVDFYCEAKQNKLLIEIKNPYIREVIMENGIPISNEPGHGYGCQSIHSITQQHHGICTFQTEQNIFILRIVLPIETATL